MAQADLTYEVKFFRAYSECLGTNRLRRTRLPAISGGELEVSFDPSISEWGNPVRLTPHYHAISLREDTPRELKHLST